MFLADSSIAPRSLGLRVKSGSVGSYSIIMGPFLLLSEMVASSSSEQLTSIVGGSDPPTHFVANPTVLYSKLPIEMIVDGFTLELLGESLLATRFLATFL